MCILLIAINSCGRSEKNSNTLTDYKSAIEKLIGATEYTRLMSLSLNEFDQSNIGFRQYSENYELLRLIIPEYIATKELSQNEKGRLHWHLGQIHAFNDNTEQAIKEMKRANSSPLFWKCYVDGSIAFLEKDKLKLVEALELLKKQDNQMNIEFLEKFVKYFDKSYKEAYSLDN